MSPTLWLALAVGLAALAECPGAAVAQDARRDIGILTCLLVESREARGGSEEASQRQTRDVLCGFRPGDRGPEETYAGTLQYLAGDQRPDTTRVMIWIVKGPPVTMETAGLLQQTYAADPAAPAGHAPALIGESNGSIALQPMADSQSPNNAGKQQPAAGALIVLVVLRLKSTSG